MSRERIFEVVVAFPLGTRKELEGENYWARRRSVLNTVHALNQNRAWFQVLPCILQTRPSKWQSVAKKRHYAKTKWIVVGADKEICKGKNESFMRYPL